MNQLAPLLSRGDVIVDSGHSYYKDTMRRGELLKASGLDLLDQGTSGGVWGLEIGYCLMIGGSRAGFERLEPTFKTLAPPDGHSYTGPSGSGVWVRRMRESMARLTPRFSTNRAVREYTERYYLPAAEAYRERAVDKGAVGRQMVNWQHALEQKWTGLRFGEMKVETDGEHHVFEVQMYLDDLDPDAVKVEIYADGVNGAGSVRQEMARSRELVGAAVGYAYSARVSATRPVTDFTARVVPHRSGVAVPLEDARILWHR